MRKELERPDGGNPSEFTHYVKLFEAFPNSYWTQADRNAMTA